MKFKSSISTKLNVLLTSFISIILLLIINFLPNTLHSIGIIATVSYLMFFVSWFIHNKVKLNFYSLFLIFSYFFFFGQFFLALIGVPMESGRTILDKILPVNMLVKTGELIINSMIILHFGVLLSTLHINKYYDERIFSRRICADTVKSSDGFKQVSVILFLVSIIPSFNILYENFIITLTRGYGAIFQSEHYTSGGFRNILRFISLFTIPSFLMMLVAFKDSKKLKFINIILIIYLMLYFLSGSRLNGVLLISVLILIKHYWFKQIKFKETMKILILAFLVLTILSTISEVRNSLYVSNNISFLLGETFKNVVIRNPIFTAMEEAGYTFLATATVVTYSPSVVPFQYGLSYINSFAMIFPNLFWDIHPAAATNTDIVFHGFLTQYGGIGSSFVAEAYWNFGYLSFFIVFIFGLLIGTLTKKIAKYSCYQNPKMFFLTIYIAQFSLFYVRSDTISFWRNITYYGIAPLILTVLLSKKKKGKSYGKSCN